MDLYKKIESSILLGVIGDVIGFGNGSIEFNNNISFSRESNGDDFIEIGSQYSNTLVFEFINNGGIYEHPKPSWTVSDDTIMLFSNIKALLKDYKDLDELINYTRLEYIDIIKEKKDLDRFERIYKGGLTTIASLKKLKMGDDYKNFKYDERAGGSGGSMRSMIYGIIFNKEIDKLKLIEICIETTCLTHNNTIAYLGAYTSGLFAYFAINNIPINRWCFQLIEILESDIIDNYIKIKKENDYGYYERDKKIFINKWKDYIEDNFYEFDFKYKKKKSFIYPNERSKYYYKFSYRKNDLYPGAGGDDSVIIAYDCLLESEGNWEKIVYYSMLHVGDSDTTGIICGFLYGLYYGIDKVNKKMIDNLLDFKEEIYKYSEYIYKKYYKIN
jgi:ADP-ribosylglycohydrolase